MNANYFGNGLGVDFGDVNNDGNMDFLIGNRGFSEYRAQFANPSLLYMNNGPNTYIFHDKHEEKGIKFFELNSGACFFDADLDGNMDLYHCQFSSRMVGDNDEPYRRSRLYINSGSPNYKFVDKTWHTGANIHGAWTAIRTDYDRDGDYDLLVASPTDSVQLFKNSIARKGDFVSIRLKGDPSNGVPLDGYGAEVRVMLVGGKTKTMQLAGGGGGSSVSQNSNELVFGLGPNAQIDKVAVVWPGLVRKDYTGISPNNNYTLHYDGTVTPVELMAFTGTVDGSSVTLSWRTASETNNSGFEVQKSTDGSSFTAIGFVKGAGTTQSQHEYSYTDRMEGRSWYRLKQVDYDGTYEYSQVVAFSPASALQFDLAKNYPNPFRATTHIRYTLAAETQVSVDIYDALGRLVRTLVSGVSPAGIHSVTWDGADQGGYPMPSGMYVCRMTAGTYAKSMTMYLQR
jgi:hypothetical protein